MTIIRSGKAALKLAIVLFLSMTVLTSCSSGSGGSLIGLSSPKGTYGFQDGSQGKAMDILPAGENGLVTASDFKKFESTGLRPSNSDNQLSMYNNFIYGSPTVTDRTLNKYFLNESFGIKANQVVKTERPNRKVNVVIYRDKNGIPHIYGSSLESMAYGAGYAGAQDRLFLMDVLRHYGEGDLMSFVGNSCDYESMDFQSLMSKAYTTADYQKQLNALKTRYGSKGNDLLLMIDSYVRGVNLYISQALKDPSMMPFEYSALRLKPTLWKPTDVVAVSTLIALEATGGGNEIQNAALLEYLQGMYGKQAAQNIFNDMKEQNDPSAPTVINTRFPYMIPKGINPSLTALPDNAPTSLTDLAGSPPQFTSGCKGGLSGAEQASGGTNTNAFGNQLNSQTSASGVASSTSLPQSPSKTQSLLQPQAMAQTQPQYPKATEVANEVASIVGSLSKLFSGKPNSESNAVVLSAKLSKSGHPIAVFGPELGYYDPEILMQEDLHAPGYSATGASFPGANFEVELGRGTDYAWSATTASTDQVDMRIEKICNPQGGQVQPLGTHYLFDGKCLAMTKKVFTESTPGTTSITSANSITRTIYSTVHGVVQGWSSVNGEPVAISRQDATTNHDIDQFVGYLEFGMPSISGTPSGWMKAASDISYSFNWFYLNSKDIAYYVSGRDPIRNPHVNPNLPTWGTGQAEWQGFLSFAAHPHAINPPNGYLVSWNNKPAPGFSASDDLYAWGPVFRSQLLTNGLVSYLKLHHNRLDRAQVAQVAENAATQDLDAYTLIDPILKLIGPSLNSTTPTGVDQMIGQLQNWAAAGYHRIKASPVDTQYQNAAAIAIWDQLYPGLVESFYSGIYGPGGTESYDGLVNGYKKVSMLFAETPNDGGVHDGDGFYSGWEGYLLKAIDQIEGARVAQPFSTSMISRLCPAPNAGSAPNAGPAPNTSPTPNMGSASNIGSNSLVDSTSVVQRCQEDILNAFQVTYNALVSDNSGSTDVASWTQDNNTVASSISHGSQITLPMFDQIEFEQAGAIPLPTMSWENRPTYQQVVEFPKVIG